MFMEGNWGFSSVKSGKNFMVLILLGEKAEIHLTLEQKKTLQRTIIYVIGRQTEGLGRIAMVRRTRLVRQVIE